MTSIPELPHPQRRAIDLVMEVAAEKECRPYLVGGPVRDLLLGRAAIDVDLTLEVGSAVLARALARRVEGRVRSYPQFLTYKVTADGLPEIDIATARKERYRKPGALPTVTAGRLKDDLLRRDFSINAIAMDLADGSLHDPTGGERDLKARLIRVLHDQSFVDDPTRIFRAVRLAKRLGFTLERDTERLMRAAIADASLESIAKERIWRELFLAMDEEDAAPVLQDLRALGALDVLFGEGSADPRLRTRLEEIARVIASDAELDRYVLFTSALLPAEDDARGRLEGSGFSQKRARNALHLAQNLGRFEQALSGARSDRQRFRLYKTASPEMLRLIASREPEEARHVARFRDYLTFKLPLRGNDLEVPGGPHVAKALERTREALFAGEIVEKDARSFARELALRFLSESRIEN
jgi:tRNA nucleotidyltransferase (CCA-adding enzyme)